MSTKKRESSWKNRRAAAGARRVRRTQNRQFAQNWFAGNATCPKCGGEHFSIVDSNSGGGTCIETFRCDAPECEAIWRVELRESAIAIVDDGTGDPSEWLKFSPVSRECRDTGSPAR